MLDTNCNNTTNIEHNESSATIDTESKILRAAAEAYINFFEAMADKERSEVDDYWRNQGEWLVEHHAAKPQKRTFWVGKLIPPPTLDQHVTEIKKSRIYRTSMETHFKYLYRSVYHSFGGYIRGYTEKSRVFTMYDEAHKMIGLARSNPDGKIQITEKYAWVFEFDWDVLTKEIAA